MYNYTVGQQAYYIPGYPNPVYPLQAIPQGVAVNAPTPNVNNPHVSACRLPTGNYVPIQTVNPRQVQAIDMTPRTNTNTNTNANTNAAPAPAPARSATHLVYVTNNPTNNNVPPARAAFQERQRLATQAQYEALERHYPNFGRNDPWAYVTDNFKTKYSIGPCGKCLKTDVDNDCPTLNGLHVCRPCYNAR